MTRSKIKAEKDYIRIAFRTLNLQALVAIILVFILPYLIFFHWGSSVFSGFNSLLYRYSNVIYQEYLLEPGQTKAMELALEYKSILVVEDYSNVNLSESSVGQRWYTDGTNITVILPGDDSPYFSSLWYRFDLGGNSRLTINPIFSFFSMDMHSLLFFTWIAMPAVFYLVLFVMMRRTLYPMRWMQKGINELTKGNLSFIAPSDSKKGSNNSLAIKFNEMTTSLGELIQSKDQLIMDVSHELRSPITKIKVAMELLERDKNVNTIDKNIYKLEEIITTILESHRLNVHDMAVNYVECDLAQLIGDCISLNKNNTPGIIFSRPEQAVCIKADQQLIKLLIHNILENAQKYSRQDSKEIEIKLFQENHNNKTYSCINITDNGIGIAEDDLEKVFEPFYKVAQQRGFNSGYGLGLSFCKRIVEVHGGSIALTSMTAMGNKENSGTQVIISLPCDGVA